MIFFDTFENRVAAWVNLRKEIETHPDPLNHALSFWNKAPISTMTCDPFDRSTWPKAWDLLDENRYCEFSKMLALSYTFSLTDRFGKEPHYLTVVADRKEHEMLYLLRINDQVLGYDYSAVIHEDKLPQHLIIQASYIMTADQI